MFYTFVQQYDTTIKGYHRSESIDGHVIVEGLTLEDINARASVVGLDFSGNLWNAPRVGFGHDSWKWSMELTDGQTKDSTTVIYFIDGTVKYSNQNWTA